MAQIKCCGFECGLLTGDGSVAGGHWRTNLGSAAISTSTIRNGARSVRCNAAGSGVDVICDVAATNELTHVHRFSVRFASLPAADMAIWATDASGTSGPNVRYQQSDGKLYAAVGSTLGASGVSVTTGTWYVIDVKGVIGAGSNDTCDVRVDGVALGQATATGAAAGTGQVRIGVIGSVTCDAFFDDTLLSLTAGDYPFGDGKVIAYVPNADGTHTAGPSVILRGTTGTPTGGDDIQAGDTTAYEWVNGTPLLGGASDNTRLWNQAANGSTVYAEIDFEPSAESAAPRAVEVICANRQAGTGAGVFAWKLNDNGTISDLDNAGSQAGTTTDKYKTVQFATAPSTGAAWTLALFNAVKARFGFSSDANPDQYARGIMIEAEYAVVQTSRQRTTTGAGR